MNLNDTLVYVNVISLFEPMIPNPSHLCRMRRTFLVGLGQPEPDKPLRFS
jgi:hypothetical protein